MLGAAATSPSQESLCFHFCFSTGTGDAADPSFLLFFLLFDLVSSPPGELPCEATRGCGFAAASATAADTGGGRLAPSGRLLLPVAYSQAPLCSHLVGAWAEAVGAWAEAEGA